jgi:3-deoxy-D-manno-octulosonic-acid transferase
MALFFYHCAWTLIVLLGLPVFSVIKNRRFFDRVFLALPAQTSWEKSIWIHALSVGEVTSAIPLIRALRQEYAQKEIVFTVTTRQGMEIARREIGDEVRLLLPMPLDFWWSLGKLIQCIKPALFVLVDGYLARADLPLEKERHQDGFNKWPYFAPHFEVLQKIPFFYPPSFQCF